MSVLGASGKLRRSFRRFGGFPEAQEEEEIVQVGGGQGTYSVCIQLSSLVISNIHNYSGYMWLCKLCWDHGRTK